MAHTRTIANAAIIVVHSSSGASTANAKQTMAAPISDPDAKLRSER